MDDVSILDTLSTSFSQIEMICLSDVVNALTEFFSDLVKTCLARFVPLKTKKTYTELPWITREILHLSQRLGRLRRVKRADAAVHTAQFISLKEELRKKINGARDFYFQVTLPGLLSSNPKKFWSAVIPKEHTTDSFEINETVARDTSIIANEFNTYFTSVFTHDNFVVPSCSHQSQSSINDIFISNHGVLNLILKLDSKKKGSPDNIDNAFLTRYSLWTSRYLTIIFQKSFNLECPSNMEVR